MRRRLERLGLLIALVLLLGPVGAAAQGPAGGGGALAQMRGERRIALVIGNGAYDPRIGPLANPANDARGLAAALEEVGFEVTLALDVDRDRMLRAVIDFGRALRAGGVGLFYYSGHALQLHGVNYMVPLGADVASEWYVQLETVPLQEVLARMGGAENRLNIVILDSCRNNPFKGVFRGTSRGLAQTPAPSGTYIAYAAAPDALALDGASGGNSPYTAALLKALEEPGLSLEDVFKRVRGEVLASTKGFQIPWTGSSITGDFFFRLPVPKPPAARSPEVELMVWKAIAASQNPTDFAIFLETYPDSPLAPFARNRVKALEADRIARLPPDGPEPTTTPREPDLAAAAETAAPQSEPAAGPVTEAAAESEAPAQVAAAPEPDPATIETALGLDREQRQEVQVALTALGHDTHGIDGILGRNSRAALSSWQRAEGEAATGYLTDTQHAALLAAAKDSLAEWRPRLRPDKEFRDCAECPLMVVVPAGSFMMGSPTSDESRERDEGPQHLVTISEPFAVGKYEVTFAEWDACVADGGCRHTPDDLGWARGNRPVINVSWQDAQSYVSWLTRKARGSYRLPSEAEWEYAARSGTATRYAWGDAAPTPQQANFGRNIGRTAEVGSYPPSRWGLYDLHGNVREWVADCWHGGYSGAPKDGEPWTTGDCSRRVLRGGSWDSNPAYLRSAVRIGYGTGYRYYIVGFRVARTLTP